MKGTAMKRILVCLPVLFIMTFALGANPLRSWNHDFNPALLGITSRKVLEWGVSPEVGVSNSYFSIGDILVEEIVIDFNDMADQIADGDLTLGVMTSVETHLTVSLMGISVGGYGDFSGVSSVGIPGELFEFLADGNSYGGTDSGSGDVYSRIFFETGVYGGYRWKDYQFGVKLGAFVPLMYTASNAAFRYSISSDAATGELSASAGFDVPFYSAINYEDVTGEDILSGLNGVNASFGAIKMKRNKPMYGISVTGIALKPAVVPYKMRMYSDASITVDSIAGNIDAEDQDDWVHDTVTDPEFEVLEEGDYEIKTPIQLGGFYRLTGFPGFIDWIGHGQVTFDEDLQYTLGATAVGAFFPLSWVSLGVEYDRVLWRTTLGVKADVHFMETGLDIGLTGPEFLSMFGTNGIYGKLYFAFGF